MTRGFRTMLVTVPVIFVVVAACRGNEDAPEEKKLGGLPCRDDDECESTLCLAGQCTGAGCECHAVSGFFGIGSSTSCSCREPGYTCTGTACRQSCGPDAGACPSGMKCDGDTCWVDVTIERREPPGDGRVPQGTALRYAVRVPDADRILIEWRIDSTRAGTLSGNGPDLAFNANISSAEAKLSVTIMTRGRGANLAWASTNIELCAPLGEPCVAADWSAKTYPPCCTGQCAKVPGTDILHCIDRSAQDAGDDAANTSADAAQDAR